MPLDIATDYAETGYHAPIRVMSTQEAADCVTRMECFRAAHPDVTDAFANNAHLTFPWLYELCLRDSVLDAVEQVIGPNILVWTTNFFIKGPGDGNFVSWHQDSTYWGLEPADIVTAWIAFTPSTRESGCLRVVGGTHSEGQLEHAISSDESNLLSRGQVVAREVREEDVADLELQPGEMSLHHVRLVHGSEPNRASWPRIGFVIRYIPTYCRQVDTRSYAVLARGEDTHDHFDYPPRPERDYDPRGLEVQADLSARLRPILFR